MLLLTSTMGFMARECSSKLLAACIISVMFLVVFLLMRPYRKNFHTLFELLAIAAPIMSMAWAQAGLAEHFATQASDTSLREVSAYDAWTMVILHVALILPPILMALFTVASSVWVVFRTNQSKEIERARSKPPAHHAALPTPPAPPSAKAPGSSGGGGGGSGSGSGSWTSWSSWSTQSSEDGGGGIGDGAAHDVTIEPDTAHGPVAELSQRRMLGPETHKQELVNDTEVDNGDDDPAAAAGEAPDRSEEQSQRRRKSREERKQKKKSKKKKKKKKRTAKRAASARKKKRSPTRESRLKQQQRRSAPPRQQGGTKMRKRRGSVMTKTDSAKIRAKAPKRAQSASIHGAAVESHGAPAASPTTRSRRSCRGGSHLEKIASAIQHVYTTPPHVRGPGRR